MGGGDDISRYCGGEKSRKFSAIWTESSGVLFVREPEQLQSFVIKDLNIYIF